MMSDNKRTPQIRFKGFTDDWEQSKLNEFSKYITSNKTSTNSISNGKYDLYDANSVIGKTNDGIVSEEYITIIKDGSGVGKVRLLPPNTAFIGTMGGILPKESDIKFIYCNLLKTDFTKEVNGATIPHIYYSSYGNNEYYIPKIEEQEYIGKIFKNIDNLITLHQRKYDKLVNMKKSMLEKMFPKNSEKVPEIRFKGFTDDWEQRKLEEISNRFDNLRIPVAANVREKGTIPYYGANGIQDYVKGFTHNGEFVLIAEDGANDLKNYPVKYVNGLFWANNHVHVIQGKKEICDNKYLKYCFSKTNIEALLVGGGRAKLNANIMMGIDLKLCQFDEQSKIGELFYEIDNLITLHQRKLEKLNNLKKSMLEKMFV